ncbi:tryptophan--tRNA ligase, partial [bacterium]|nr:tryptophan--tRNA ligase [bacterium]
MHIEKLEEDNIKLIKEFGASPISEIKNLPDFYTFDNDLFYSHRDFDKFLARLEKGEASAIVSGFNASGTIHLGHKAVFDTNLFFQRKYGLKVFIPISDDESYVSGKVETQKEAYKNSLNLVKDLLAYGFDPQNTYFIIDQVYTNIYNYAIMLSKKIIFSISRASYGHNDQTNLGLIFYSTIQSAHILFPQLEFGIKNILVPIGPDEDVHIRVCRDLASKFNLVKPASIHSRFMPGLDGQKMSKSKNNFISFRDSKTDILKKVNKALSGGRETLEEHKRLGGIPENDISAYYLEKYFLDKISST